MWQSAGNVSPEHKVLPNEKKRMLVFVSGKRQSAPCLKRFPSSVNRWQ